MAVGMEFQGGGQNLRCEIDTGGRSLPLTLTSTVFAPVVFILWQAPKDFGNWTEATPESKTCSQASVESVWLR